MAQVTIPKRFFLEESTKEYSDYKFRLSAEIIQNSRDAGATRIDITFTDDGYSITDNGSGMDKQTLLSGMLTLGGSIKSDDATGAFGAAKKLVLFSHESYEIQTQDLLAIGSVLDYDLKEGQPWFNGTRIACKYFDKFGSVSDMVYSAEYFLKKCDFSNSCQVFINGEEFTDWMAWPQANIEERDWCTVKSRPGNGYIYVKKNGIFSFYRYTSSKKEAIVELKPPSRECLTQNREGLRSPYKEKLDVLASEMTVDEMSFGLPGVREYVYIGREKFIQFIADMSNKSEEAYNIIQNFGGKDIVCYQSSNADKMNVLKELNKTINTKDIQDKLKQVYAELCDTLENSFIVDLSDSEHQTVPEKYAPKTMMKRYSFLAQLWKATIIEILKLYGQDLNFQIGFTLNKEAKALYQRKKGEPVRLFINPDLFDFTQSYENRFWALFVSALEETCHALTYQNEFVDGHGETFNFQKNKILTKILPQLSWRTVWKNAQTTTL